jgi:RNA polymerase sigma factor (sigma-70 family)
VEPRDKEELRADLARIGDGDRVVLERAFTRLHPLVRGFCGRVLGDGPLADDAAQDALVNLFAHVGAYDPERDPVPWVLAFASNACRTVRKRTSRQREVPDLPELAAAGSPEAEVLDAELRAAVRATLAALSPIDGETLALAMGERPTGATFRKRLERAIGRFRAAWSER